MSVLKLIASSSYITVNVALAEQLGLHEAVVFGALCSGSVYCESKGLTEGGYFPFSIELLQERTTLARKAQDSAINHLIEVGLLEKRNIGTPCKRYFKVNEDRLEVVLQFVPHGQTRLSLTDKLDCPKGANYINNNNINTLYLKENSREEYKADATKELNIDDQIAMTIEAWNSNKHIRATIDRIPFGTKRYDHMMLTIAQFGWEKFIEEIRSLDSNKFFEEWQPGFDWIADPNNFMKLCEGNYRSGKRKETSDNGWTQEERERMERWLAEDDEK